MSVSRSIGYAAAVSPGVSGRRGRPPHTLRGIRPCFRARPGRHTGSVCRRRDKRRRKENPMNPDPAPSPNPRSTPATIASLQPPPVVVAGRLKGMFAPGYLTLVSIIQGVALATLAGQVEAGYARLDAVAWILAAATLVSYIGVWNEYAHGAATYVWLPNLADAVVPFGIATLELFLAHFAVLGVAGLRDYLLVVAVTFFAAALSFVQVGLRLSSPQAEADNRDVHRSLVRPRTARIGQCVVSGLLALALWAVYDVAGLGAHALVVALVAAALPVAFLLGSVPYWNRVVAYAQAA
ncbi:MAG TPA: hypothetical protein VF510_20840 [Ktedonobacterales bacterium]